MSFKYGYITLFSVYAVSLSVCFLCVSGMSTAGKAMGDTDPEAGIDAPFSGICECQQVVYSSHHLQSFVLAAEENETVKLVVFQVNYKLLWLVDIVQSLSLYHFPLLVLISLETILNKEIKQHKKTVRTNEDVM